MVNFFRKSKKVISDFKDKGYNFNHIVGIKIATTANNKDMSYEFLYQTYYAFCGMEIIFYD